MPIASVWSQLKKTFTEFSEHHGMRLAAALACYTILSLAPLIVITMKLTSIIFGEEAAARQIQSQAGQLVGSVGADAIQQMMENASKPGAGVLATIISFAVLLFSASGVFAELQDSMNTIWEVKPSPNMSWFDTIKKRFLSVAMVFGIIFLLLVSMFITAMLGAVVGYFTGGSQTEQGIIATILSYALDFVVTTLVVWAMFMGIFRFLPDVKLTWRDVWLGALVTAVLFKFGQYLLAAYFYFGSTTSAYGAAGSLVAVLLWAYYSSAILFFGAEFTRVSTEERRGAVKKDVDAVKLTETDLARQGIPKQGTLVAAEEYAHRGALPLRGPLAPPRVVPITKPSPKAARTYFVAGAGLAAGFVVGAIGMLSGRKYMDEGIEQLRLNHRLDQIESRVGRGRTLKHVAAAVRIQERLDQIDRRTCNAQKSVRRHQDHRPAWVKRLSEFVAPN